MKERRTCRRCGKLIQYKSRSFSWAHVSPGSDHAPMP